MSCQGVSGKKNHVYLTDQNKGFSVTLSMQIKISTVKIKIPYEESPYYFTYFSESLRVGIGLLSGMSLVIILQLGY